jgi:orotate phosphoribosyltransferase
MTMTPDEANDWLGAHPPKPGNAKAGLLAMLRVFSYQEREVTLASGASSNFYIDCRPTLLLPEAPGLAARALHMAVCREKWITPNEYTPAGSGLGGGILAGAAGAQACKGTVYVRKSVKGHGTQQRIERAVDVPDKANVIIFDDVATSGGSALDVARCLFDAGYHVRGCAVLVDRQEGAQEAFEKAGIPFLALFTPADFVDP